MTNPAQTNRPAVDRLNALRRWVALLVFSGEESAALRKHVQQEGALTAGYVLMCALSAGIATLGLLQSSVAVVIGAMLISPLMNPIAALGFGFASLDGHRVRDAVRVVAIGACVGVIVALVLTFISPIRNTTPEIIGRTQPTLLDLAVALFSGVAGGYATVRQKGGTAIGVAIATALMPPLATVGYSIAVANWEFAGGAFLLFLTNLAAIAFSFAFIARLSGVARPLSHVELTPGYIAVGVMAFLVLATPLGLTLVRVSKEATARATARSVLTNELGIDAGKIAQLDVRWPLFGELTVDAVVIEKAYLVDAQQRVNTQLARRLDATPEVTLQQIVASDDGSQTRALIDAAVERNAAGIARDVPPLEVIRARTGIPLQTLWVDRATRAVYTMPIDVAEWTLDDYRSVESNVGAGTDGWSVRIIPPLSRELLIRGSQSDSIRARDVQLALWALGRWASTRVQLEPVAQVANARRRGATATRADSTQIAQAQQQLATIASLLKAGGVEATFNAQSVTADMIAARIRLTPTSPVQAKTSATPSAIVPSVPIRRPSQQ